MAEPTFRERREFIIGTRFRKTAIILPPEQNPAEFRPSKAKLAHARKTGFDLARPRDPARQALAYKMRREVGIFWQLPEKDRPRAKQLLAKNLDEWRRYKGIDVKPGHYLYPLIILGIIQTFRRAWTREEARKLREYQWRRFTGIASIKVGGINPRPKLRSSTRKQPGVNILGEV